MVAHWEVLPGHLQASVRPQGPCFWLGCIVSVSLFRTHIFSLFDVNTLLILTDSVVTNQKSFLFKRIILLFYELESYICLVRARGLPYAVVFSAIIHVKYVPYCNCKRRPVLDVKLYTYYIYFWFILLKKYTLGVSIETGTHRVSFQRGETKPATWRPVYLGTSHTENDSRNIGYPETGSRWRVWLRHFITSRQLNPGGGYLAKAQVCMF